MRIQYIEISKLCNTAKALLRRVFIANTYIGTREQFQLENLSFHFKKLKRKSKLDTEQENKEIIKIEINKIKKI